MARSHLSRLLAQVGDGESVTITRRGVPVARLVPVSAGRAMSPREAITALRAFRQGKTLGGLPVRDLIEEGRQY
jgi:prevent-host-death family protein